MAESDTVMYKVAIYIAISSLLLLYVAPFVLKVNIGSSVVERIATADLFPTSNTESLNTLF